MPSVLSEEEKGLSWRPDAALKSPTATLHVPSVATDASGKVWGSRWLLLADIGVFRCCSHRSAAVEVRAAGDDMAA